MAQISAYLTSDGSCREAMSFSRDCLGAELRVLTVGETPVASQLPAAAKDLVMHASLTKGAMALMASDRMGTAAPVRGNTISLMIVCDSEDELRGYVAKLSAGGKMNQPVKQEFWGAIYGELTGRFGMRWMLNYEKPRAGGMPPAGRRT